MKQRLLNVLTTYGYPIYLHGTLGEDEPFPQSFFTFKQISSSDICLDDGDAYAVYGFQVCFFSTDPHTVESVAASSRIALRDAGFIPDGRGMDFPSEEATHTGWITEYFYIEEV